MPAETRSPLLKGSEYQYVRERVTLPDRVVTVVRTFPLAFRVRVMVPLDVLVRVVTLLLPFLPVLMVIFVAMSSPYRPDRNGQRDARQAKARAQAWVLADSRMPAWYKIHTNQ